MSDNLDRRRTLDAGTVVAWSSLTADENPLHTDAAYAARSRFGTTIVQGHLLAVLAADAVQRLEPGAGIRLTCTFREPVVVGSDFVMSVAPDATGSLAASGRCADREVMSVDAEWLQEKSSGEDRS